MRDTHLDTIETPQTVHEQPKTQKPGELVFAGLVTAASLFLLWSAYGISGFKSLSSPGVVPMATTAVMVVTALIILIRTARRPRNAELTLKADIVPVRVIAFIVMLALVGLAFKPLGFLPTAAIFLVIAMKYLGEKGWLHTITIAIGSLIGVWIVFRLVFTVLLPTGFVPEAEIIQFFRNLIF